MDPLQWRATGKGQREGAGVSGEYFKRNDTEENSSRCLRTFHVFRVFQIYPSLKEEGSVLGGGTQRVTR